MRKNDPYQNMERHQTRPNDIKRAAQDSLKQAESSASSISHSSRSTKGTKGEKAAAETTQSNFKNNVKGRPSSASTKTQKKGFFKGKGPLTAILFLVFGGGALFFSGQSVLGPHISNLFTQATDVQFTSYSLRNQRLFSFMLDGGSQIRVTPFSQKFTMFTPYMKGRLANNGIEVGHLNSSGDFIPGDLLAGQARALNFNGEVISAADFSTKYATDANFRDAYYKAKRGRVAGFFDDASDFVYKKLGLTRNIFDEFKTSGNADADSANFVDTMDSHLGGTDTTMNTVGRTTDDNGTPNDPSDDITSHTRNGDDIDVNNVPGDTPEAKARALSTDLVSKVSNAGNLFCTAMRVANLANIAAFAASTANSVNYFMGLTENISKMMAGEGDTSAINDVLNFFTTSTTSEVPSIDDNGNATTTQVTGSPLQSNGARIVLGGIVPTKYEVSAYSLETITSTAKRTVLVQGGTTVACSGVRAAAAVVSLVATGIPGGAIARVVIGMLAETVGGIVITGIMASVISAIVPVLGRTLFSNVMETYTGIPAGELYSQGAAAANGRVAQTASGFTPGSSNVIEANARATSAVLALEAELDRKNRSPFDITSHNTFLGSLVVGFLPLLTSSSPTTPISTISSLTSSAIGKLLPAAFAAEAANSTFTTIYGDCSALEEIGIKGDIYCNAIMTSDLSTVDVAPDDSQYTQIISRNLTADAQEVKDGSELAKFITFCANRESPWGVTDANILNALQTDAGIVLNNIPVLNNVIDLINAVQDNLNMDWATGAMCVNTPDNHRWDNEFKYYQRFVEDMRILDQMGAYHGADSTSSKNPVLAFQEKYYEQNPLDNSPQGYLARITGMTKADVAFLLEFINYNNFLAEYDPTNLYPVVASSEPTTKLSFTSNSPAKEQGTLLGHIIYADTRTRSYAI